MGVNMNKVANRETRIRVKNINSGESINFDTRIESARFVGASDGMVRYEIGNSQARVFCIDGEEYVFVYDDEERQIKTEYKSCMVHPPLTQWLIEAVSKTGERTPLYSYLTAARFFGLLIGDVQEKEKREEKGALARVFIVDGEEYTMEFGERERKKNGRKGIHCRWRGIYDRVWWT